MNNGWNRRNFLKRVALGCTAAASVSTCGFVLHDKGRNEPDAVRRILTVRDFSSGLDISDLKKKIFISKGAPEDAVLRALKALGGMNRFVKPGETVVIKPNVGWDRTPVQAANTNPLVVGALVKACFEARASSVVVTDHTCNEASRCFTRSGIWKAAEQNGAEVVLPSSHRFRLYDLGGRVLHTMPVLVPAVTADRFINVPIAKHHGLSGFTGAMKNLYGVLGGRRNRLHQRIDDSIADLADFIRPTLTIMDATRVLMQNGPQGGDIGDVKEVGEIIASVDQVAVDTYASGLIGLSPNELPYLSLAQKRGLGHAALDGVERVEVP